MTSVKKRWTPYTSYSGIEKIDRKPGTALKLISGMMMLFPGVVIFLDPDLLNNPAAPVGMLAAALVSSPLLSIYIKKYREPTSSM